jgi:L-malate glycosyltransferase
MHKKVKILHLIKSLGRGGAEMLLPETLSKHNAERYEFHYIYFLPWKDQVVPLIQSNGGIVRCIPARNNLQIMGKAWEIAAYVRQQGIQMIHCHLPWAGIVGRVAGKLARVPVVYTEHNKWERYHKLTYWLNRVTFGMQRAVVAVSDDVEESIRKHTPGLTFANPGLDAGLPFPGQPSFFAGAAEAGKRPAADQDNQKGEVGLVTILNGVNTHHFKKDFSERISIRDKLGIPADAPVIGTVAVFRFQKRLDLWMEQALQILKRVPEAHFILVGDGPLKAELLQKRAALGLEDRLHMPGLQTQVRPYFSAMDLFMMASVFEGLPIALLEAMSCSCGVISTAAGGIKQVVVPGESGYLCEVDNYQELEDLAVRLLADPEERERVGAGARTRVQDSFSIEQMVHQLEQLYEHILADIYIQNGKSPVNIH